MRIRVEACEQKPGDIEFDSMKCIRYMLEEIGDSIRQADVDGWEKLDRGQQMSFWEHLRILHQLATDAAMPKDSMSAA